MEKWKTPVGWSIVNMTPKELNAHKRNPRTITKDRFELLKKQIERQGFRVPPTIDHNGTLLAGHQRVRALIDLGQGDIKIPVMMPDRELTEDERKEVLVTDNIGWGDDDYDILSADFDLGELIELGMEGLPEIDADGKPAEKDASPEMVVQCPECGGMFDAKKHKAKSE